MLVGLGLECYREVRGDSEPIPISCVYSQQLIQMLAVS